MGGRLSRPRGPDGLSEGLNTTSGSAPSRLSKNRGIINGRTIMAPLLAVTMAGILFVYSRTSIRAAKLNAQKHREADGGQISWHRESLRRHGQIEEVKSDGSTLKDALFADLSRKKQDNPPAEEGKARAQRSADEDRLRRLMGKDK